MRNLIAAFCALMLIGMMGCGGGDEEKTCEQTCQDTGGSTYNSCLANGGDGQWGQRCTEGVGAVVGTTAAPVIGEEWGVETPASVQRNFHLFEPYTRSSFNALRLAVLHARAAFMGSEGGGVKPWLSPKSASSLRGSDYTSDCGSDAQGVRRTSPHVYENRSRNAQNAILVKLAY